MGARFGRLLSVVTVILLLASCGQSGPVGAGSVAPVATSTTAGASPSAAGRAYPGTLCRAVHFGSLATDGVVVRPRLAADFAPVTVASCSVESERVAGQGEWSVLVEKRASTDIAALVTAMRRPDETKTAGPCRLNLDLDPEVWFLDATGRAVLPGWPRDSCNHLTASSTQALEALHWTVAARVRIAQSIPQAVIDAGCTTTWKYLFALTTPGSKAGSFADLAHASNLHLCAYRRSSDDPMRGDFTSGHAIEASAWAALKAALEAATVPAASCGGQATRFAVLNASSGSSTEIELDGCRRILTPDNGLRQATPELIAMLT